MAWAAKAAIARSVMAEVALALGGEGGLCKVDSSLRGGLSTARLYD
jgi:hypothetical protein